VLRRCELGRALGLRREGGLQSQQQRVHSAPRGTGRGVPRLRRARQLGSGRRSTARFLGVQLGGLGGFSSNRHSVLRAVNLQRQSVHSLAVRRQQRGQGRRLSGKLMELAHQPAQLRTRGADSCVAMVQYGAGQRLARGHAVCIDV